MRHNIYIYILITALVSYGIRMLPMVLLRKEIKSPFIRSFLYYVPYVTLAVMTFPAIVNATQSPALALICGILVAWFHGGLFEVAVVCCAITFVAELFLK